MKARPPRWTRLGAQAVVFGLSLCACASASWSGPLHGFGGAGCALPARGPAPPDWLAFLAHRGGMATHDPDCVPEILVFRSGRIVWRADDPGSRDLNDWREGRVDPPAVRRFLSHVERMHPGSFGEPEDPPRRLRLTDMPWTFLGVRLRERACFSRTGSPEYYSGQSFAPDGVRQAAVILAKLLALRPKASHRFRPDVIRVALRPGAPDNDPVGAWPLAVAPRVEGPGTTEIVLRGAEADAVIDAIRRRPDLLVRGKPCFASWAPDYGLPPSPVWKDEQFPAGGPPHEQPSGPAPRLTLGGGREPICGVEWERTGRLIAAASPGESPPTSIWNGRDGSLVKSGDWRAFCIAWRPEGEELAFGAMEFMMSATVPSLELGSLYAWAGPPVVSSISWAPDGSRIAACCGPMLGVWSGAGNTVRWKREPTFATCVAWQPHGSLLATAGGSGAVELWDAGSGSVVKTLRASVDPLRRPLYAPVAWNPRGDRVVAGTLAPGGLVVWDAATGRVVRRLYGPRETLRAIAWRSAADWIAAACGRSVCVWDAASARPYLVIRPATAVYSLAWSPDSTELAAGCGDGAVRIYSLPRTVRNNGIPSRISQDTRTTGPLDRSLCPCRTSIRAVQR